MVRDLTNYLYMPGVITYYNPLFKENFYSRNVMARLQDVKH